MSFVSEEDTPKGLARKARGFGIMGMVVCAVCALGAFADRKGGPTWDFFWASAIFWIVCFFLFRSGNQKLRDKSKSN
jgi:hypothetical protein